MHAPIGWLKLPNVPLINKAFALEFNAIYIGSVMVKPSTKLCMNIDKKIDMPSSGLVLDVEYMMKPSGNLCNVIAIIVCNPIDSNLESGVFI